MGRLQAWFFLPVRVLSRLFRRLFLQLLEKAFDAGKLQFFTALQHLNECKAFRRYLAPLRKTDWVVYAKPPFAGSEQVLDYVGRYTHRVAISNNRLVNIEDGKVAFRWKDYRRRSAKGHERLGRRIHPPLSVARPARGLSSDPLLRFPRQSLP